MNIKALLIANRGEVAVRVMRACRSLGIRSVAVFSDADRRAPHVRLADSAIRIGPAAARDSYLDIESVIAAARKSGVDAVHPGYGFLSENAAFAGACEDQGLVFVGPPSEVIACMGSKQRARAAAAAAGLSVVPGYHGAAQDDESLVSAADEVGYPLMIKASAGGGGRGMRRVYRRSDFLQALDLARGEAHAAFGDATMLLERLVESARHVEVQLLADRQGHLVHLFDRDCTIQRSHQKLIEEAPAVGLPADVRGIMLEQAVSLARQIGYVNAGTVEFIHDVRRGDCLFLEMNTRLQVEHPVTEAVTGIDIVEWQLRIAAGEALAFDQEGVECHGHAIEARIAAEDAASAFAPRTGVVIEYREPRGLGLRVDSGIESGSIVGHHYDSMLAKVIAHDSDRARARRLLIRALGDYTIRGVETNTRFLGEVLDAETFAEDSHTTDFIDKVFADGWRGVRLSSRHLGELALGSLLKARASDSVLDPWRALGGWRVSPVRGANSIRYVTIDSGDPREVSIIDSGDRWQILVDDEFVFEAVSAEWTDDALILEIDGCRRRISMCVRGYFAWHGECPGTGVQLLEPEQVLLSRDTRVSGHENQVRAPMPGRLMELHVSVGDQVCSGQVVAVFEAMKMYQELPAPIDGAIAGMHCKVGDNLEGGAIILEIEREASSTEVLPGGESETLLQGSE